MTAEFSNLDLAKYLDQARQEGFSNVATIEKPKGKIVIAFNQEHTLARVFHELENGRVVPLIKPSKVFASKSS